MYCYILSSEPPNSCNLLVGLNFSNCNITCYFFVDFFISEEHLTVWVKYSLNYQRLGGLRMHNRKCLLMTTILQQQINFWVTSHFKVPEKWFFIFVYFQTVWTPSLFFNPHQEGGPTRALGGTDRETQIHGNVPLVRR